MNKKLRAAVWRGALALTLAAAALPFMGSVQQVAAAFKWEGVGDAVAPVTFEALSERRVVDGYGRGVPLRKAVDAIVPAGFTKDIVLPRTMDPLVSYEGGRPWDVVLSAALEKVDLTSAIVDQVVFVYRQGRPPEVVRSALAAKGRGLSPAAAESKKDEPLELAAAAPFRLDGSEKIPPAPMPPRRPSAKPKAPMEVSEAGGVKASAVSVHSVWIAEKGETLNMVLAKWAEQANPKWTLAWEADVDYRLMATASFKGDFAEAASGILGAFSGPLVAKPLRGDLYRGNNVIVVNRASAPGQ